MKLTLFFWGMLVVFLLGPIWWWALYGISYNVAFAWVVTDTVWFIIAGWSSL